MTPFYLNFRILVGVLEQKSRLHMKIYELIWPLDLIISVINFENPVDFRNSLDVRFQAKPILAGYREVLKVMDVDFFPQIL